MFCGCINRDISGTSEALFAVMSIIDIDCRDALRVTLLCALTTCGSVETLETQIHETDYLQRLKFRYGCIKIPKVNDFSRAAYQA